MDSIIYFVQNHILIAMLIGAGLLFLVYRKPRLFFSILFLGLILVVTYYLIMSTAGSGSKQTERLLLEGEKQSDTDR